MEDRFVSVKENVIEALMSETVRLQDTVNEGDFEKVNDCVLSRSSLFKALTQADLNIGQRPTSRDADWLRRLSSMKNLQEEIDQKLEAVKQGLTRERLVLRKQKEELVRSISEVLKGQGISVRG